MNSSSFFKFHYYVATLSLSLFLFFAASGDSNKAIGALLSASVNAVAMKAFTHKPD